MKILLIETATQVCSVALCETPATDGSTPDCQTYESPILVAQRESDSPNAHSSHLAVFVDEIMKERCMRPADLDAVCVSSGPGSYTGLRIGVSSAKGLCYALGKPLIAVPTLESMAALYYRQHPDYQGMVCPMIDARRMECYTMVVESGERRVESGEWRVENGERRTENGELRILRDTHADIFDAPASSPLSTLHSPLDEWLDRGVVTFIGDGAAKTRPVLGNHPNARFDETFVISAEGMADIAARKLAACETEDVAYFEPFYLKDFVAKKSVVHGLR